MRGFGRGIVWFNGRNLGRYWKAGPPQTVFIPACWMKKGEDNELVVLELEAERIPDKIPSVPKPIWGAEP
jgi:beta-galactosidase